MTKANWPKTLLRLPHDAHTFLKKQAELNASSVNSEIVRCVRERMANASPAGAVPETAIRDRFIT
jgi:hypothetical protein